MQILILVRHSMAQSGLDFGVFDPSGAAKAPEPAKQSRVSVDDAHHGDSNSSDEERSSRPVIKLRSGRHSSDSRRSLSRPRSRRDINLATDEVTSADMQDIDSLTNIRFSGEIVSKTPVEQLLPFAVIAPEKRVSRPQITTGSENGGHDTPVLSPSSPQQPRSPEDHPLPETPVTDSPQLPYSGPLPESLKDVFVRKYRWGTIDVLDPAHCDFSVLRTAILSSHFQVRIDLGQYWNLDLREIHHSF